MKDTFNGWHNWETWNANLWLINDEPVYRATLLIKSVQELQNVFLQFYPHGTPDMESPADMFAINWEEIYNNLNTEL